MRILQLVQWLSPHQHTGGIIRSTNLGRILSRFADVDVVGFHAGADGTALESSPALRHYRTLHPVRLGGTLQRAIVTLANIGQGYSLRSAAFRAPAYRLRVDTVLRQTTYDAIHVEGLPFMQALGRASISVPIVYSAHNVESVLSSRLLGARADVLRRWLAVDRQRTESEERHALAQARLCLVVSDDDRLLLQRIAAGLSCEIQTVPNCVDDDIVPASGSLEKADALSEVVCIASFAWYPNRQGAMWFLDEILPRLRRSGFGLPVRFVGSAIARDLAKKIVSSGCVYSPDVPSILPYLHRARVAVVPLLIGGGTRIKIVEAWAAGVPVVATRIGAEGLRCVHREDLMLGDEPDSFADALRKVVDDDDLHRHLRANGLRRAEGLRWSKVAAQVERLYAALAQKSGEARS